MKDRGEKQEHQHVSAAVEIIIQTALDPKTDTGDLIIDRQTTCEPGLSSDQNSK